MRNRARPSPLLLLLLSCQSSIPLDRPTRWQGCRQSHSINHILKRTCKNYATSKAEYTNTQLDLPGVRNLLYLSTMQLLAEGFRLPKALAESKINFSFSNSRIITFSLVCSFSAYMVNHLIQSTCYVKQTSFHFLLNVVQGVKQSH